MEIAYLSDVFSLGLKSDGFGQIAAKLRLLKTNSLVFERDSSDWLLTRFWYDYFG